MNGVGNGDAPDGAVRRQREMVGAPNVEAAKNVDAGNGVIASAMSGRNAKIQNASEFGALFQQSLRRARAEASECEDASLNAGAPVVPYAGMILRLEFLQERLASVFADIVKPYDFFDISLASGDRPRLFIDPVAFVELADDGRTYCFIRESRSGRRTVLRSSEVSRVSQAVVDYVARRVVEQERAHYGEPRNPTPVATESSDQESLLRRNDDERRNDAEGPRDGSHIPKFDEAEFRQDEAQDSWRDFINPDAASKASKTVNHDAARRRSRRRRRKNGPEPITESIRPIQVHAEIISSPAGQSEASAPAKPNVYQAEMASWRGLGASWRGSTLLRAAVLLALELLAMAAFAAAVVYAGLMFVKTKGY